MPQIPDEAVEAAAKVAWRRSHEMPWSAAAAGFKSPYLREAREGLEAAAPYLLVDAIKTVLPFMEAWAGDKELGFLTGFLEAAEESLKDAGDESPIRTSSEEHIRGAAPKELF